jgi:hypothetical protein
VPAPPTSVVPPPPAAVRIAPSTVVVRQRPVTVDRAPVPLWRDRGWCQGDGETWHGQYHLPHGVWQGRVVRIGRHKYRPYILDPPAETRRHAHWQCLGRSSDRESYLHFSIDPTSADAAIVAMETFLAESFAAAGAAKPGGVR